MIVNDFVKKINKYWASYYVTSGLIYVGESMYKWYGLGGHCINMVLPMYVEIDLKPVNGRDIQNSCDSRSQAMMQLKSMNSEAD